ncbi:MAG: DUF3494 domain-containing protein [Nitrospirae bacterium]|nr:DUF3494 domain-containing protein [Nitrospirota bacterium]
MFYIRKINYLMMGLSLLASMVFVALTGGVSPALAATAPDLLSNGTYGIVSKTFTNSNFSPYTIINGNVCYTTGPDTPPITITGTAIEPCTTQISDQATALAALNGQSCTSIGAAVDLSLVSIDGGTTGVIPPGCYVSTGALNIGTTVHLHGDGVYIFRSTALNTADDSVVSLDNGACADNVFWAPGAATTLGANSTFSGTIIDNAGITIGHLSTVTGRLMASGGTVTIDADTITVPTACATPTTTTTSATTTSTTTTAAPTTTTTSISTTSTTTTAAPTTTTTSVSTTSTTTTAAPTTTTTSISTTSTTTTAAPTTTTTSISTTSTTTTAAPTTTTTSVSTTSTTTTAAPTTTTTTVAPTPTSTASMRLLKTVNNTGGGTATAGQFMLTATGNISTGPMVITGTTPVSASNVPLGVYTLTETGPTGYTAAYSCSGGGTLVGNKLIITSADAGNTITCTIANAWTPDTSVKLGLLKSVVNTGGGTAAASDFMLTATGDSSTGPMVITGTAPVSASNAPLGIYTLTETGPTGYTAGYSCSGGGTLVGNKLTITSADAGNTITCTIANTWTSTDYINLAISKTGKGSGTVTSSDSKINCGSTCSASYSPPISTTLTATAAPGSRFAGWSGGTCSGTGTCVVSSTTGVTVTATFTSGTVIKGDFFGEGMASIIWRNYSTGENSICDNTTIPNTNLPIVTDLNWELVGVGDFGSGVETDIIWRHKTYGDNVVWHLNAGVVTSEQWLPSVTDTNWSIMGTGNFSGTGNTDILWRSVTGENVVWHMSGITPKTTTSLPTLSDTNWMIVGTGDFKGDNSTTIIWRHKLYGYNAYWFMSGATIAEIGSLPYVADVNWEIGGVADFDGDGKPDILWRHKTYGYNVIWFMNGTTVKSVRELTSIIDTNWKIVGTK